jgi:two-component system response regulator AtoC
MADDKLKILVVDDEDQLRDFLTDGLLSLGCQVKSTGGAAQGLEMIRQGLREEPWDVLVTDLNLADQDGVWLLKESRKLDPDLVVLIITGYGSVESAVEALQLGAADYIQKPFKLETLKLKLDRSWQARQLGRENRLLKRDLALYQIYDLFMGSPDREKLLNIALQSLNHIAGNAGIKIKLTDGTQKSNPAWQNEFELYALQASLESKGTKHGMIYLKPLEGELDPDQRTGLALLAKNVSLALQNLELMNSLKERMEQLEAQRADLLDSYKYAVLGEISSSLVHEMKNPLSAITLGVEFLGMCTASDDKLQKALGSISKSVERLNMILENLSLYSRDSSDTKSTALLSDIIKKAAGLVNYYLAGKKVKLEINNGEYEKPVMVNQGQIQQALVDLLVFQSKKMDKGGDINIAVNHRDDEMAITMHSPWLVIDQAELAGLMEPALISWQPGRDLSLNLARRLLEENNCRLQVVSSPDRGTEFEMNFAQRH